MVAASATRRWRRFRSTQKAIAAGVGVADDPVAAKRDPSTQARTRASRRVVADGVLYRTLEARRDAELVKWEDYAVAGPIKEGEKLILESGIQPRIVVTALLTAGIANIDWAARVAAKLAAT